MTLGEKQRKFTRMVADLIIFAYEQGYELSFGDAWATTGHMKNSLHYSRLAIDLNLFKDGIFLVDGAAHTPLHDYWDTLGGSPRILKDMNHYSIEHEGRK